MTIGGQPLAPAGTTTTSIQLIAEIRNARSLRSDLKFLLLTLVSYGRGDGTGIYPSCPRLAGDLGKTVRAVQLGLRELEALGAGVLKCVHASAGGRLAGGHGRTSEYRYDRAALLALPNLPAAQPSQRTAKPVTPLINLVDNTWNPETVTSGTLKPDTRNPETASVNPEAQFTRSVNGSTNWDLEKKERSENREGRTYVVPTDHASCGPGCDLPPAPPITENQTTLKKEGDAIVLLRHFEDARDGHLEKVRPHGFTRSFSPSDIKHAERLVAEYSYDALTAAIATYFARSEIGVVKRGFPFALFMNQIVEWLIKADLDRRRRELDDVKQQRAADADALRARQSDARQVQTRDREERIETAYDRLSRMGALSALERMARQELKTYEARTSEEKMRNMIRSKVIAYLDNSAMLIAESTNDEMIRFVVEDMVSHGDLESPSRAEAM